MKTCFLLMFAGMIVALTCTSVALAAGRFDGKWEVGIATKSGSCQIANFLMRVHHGVMQGTASSGQHLYRIQGHVMEDGHFSWRWGYARGQLSGNTGTGHWATPAGSLRQYCSGDISLQRE